MAKIAKSYLLSHDIDWFFCTGNRIVHCASNTALIPQKCADNSNLKITQEIIAFLPIIYSLDQISINQEYEESYILRDYRQILDLFGDDFPLKQEEYRAQYLETFIKMAQRGLWTYDHQPDLEENEYILVAHPEENTPIESLLDMHHPLQRAITLKDIIPTGIHFNSDNNKLFV